MIKKILKNLRFSIIGYKAEKFDELPDKLSDIAIYFIGNGRPWMAGLMCPCGCGSIIELSLLENDSPKWRYRFDYLGRLTIQPSIWKKSGCHSHFCIIKGHISWCSSNS